MNGPAFVSAELSFGRHQGRFDLPSGRPAVVAGPNGSGKTTLVDGLLRTVFGFNRRSPDDRRLADARRPWTGGTFRSAVRIETSDGTYDWARDHETDEVRVVDGNGALVFGGPANPGAQGSSDREYWRLVRRLFGVSELDSYARTAFVSQGRLLAGTEFDADLLRLAEGGHARWQEACRRLELRHRELTREPISADQRRLGRDRELENLRDELSDVLGRRAAARAAVESRTAASARLVEVEARIGDLSATIEAGEARRLELAELARLDAEIADARQRFDRLIDLREDLADAGREVRETDAACDQLAPGAGYPDDFPSRATALRAAWHELERQSDALDRLGPPIGGRDLTPRIAGLLAIAGLLVVTGGWLGLAVATWFWGFTLLGAALAALGVGELRARRASLAAARKDADQAIRRRGELEEKIAGLLRGVPGAGRLDASTLDDRLDQFERRRAAEGRREAARRRRSEVMRRIEKAGEAQDRPGRDLPHLVADAERRLNGREAQRRELSRVLDPDGVEALSTRAVERGLADARSELEELRAERDRLRISLDRAARAAGDLAGLEERAAELDERLADIEATVAALRAAHTLLRDGYDEFRNQDEERLVASVSEHLEALGDPSLGPFRTAAGLEGPTVGLAERRLAFDSLELSHGQRHLVMLAVRLGAADFLSLDGPAAPLIVDEPFAHLDDRHAAGVWNLLEKISLHRQVIVTTQDEDRLERFGVQPAIRFAGSEMAAATGGPATSG